MVITILVAKIEANNGVIASCDQVYDPICADFQYK